MAEPEVFARRIASLAAAVEVNADRAVRSAALAIDQAVVMATPVDTGRARSNWFVEVDAVPRQVGEAQDKTGATAMAQGQAAISRYGKGNRFIAISNNLPYIGRLNEGWSAQAPAGFVERAVQAGIAAVRKAGLIK